MRLAKRIARSPRNRPDQGWLRIFRTSAVVEYPSTNGIACAVPP
jgi:hypothetical protein